MMLRIGLTGGIGSGKTTVGSIFSALNIPVYAADKEAKRLMESNRDLIEAVEVLFGTEAYNKGILNRKFIAERAFADNELLEKLNAIVHPMVQKDFKEWSEKMGEYPYVIEEAAILFESGAAKRMDYTIFVKSSEKTRIERVKTRDNVSEEEIRLRMKNQMDEGSKEELADFILLNDQRDMLLPQVVSLHEKIIQLNSK